MKTFIFILTISSLLLSCGKLTGESTGANQVNEQIPLIGNSESVEIAPNLFRLEGSASLGGRSGHNFELKLKLPIGQEVTFYFFASSQLSGGYTLKLKNEDGRIFATFSLNGKSHLFELVSLRDQVVLHLDLDLHNDHSDLHALLWNHLGPHGDSDECTFEETCLYNSEDFAIDEWLGVGRASGVYWGFQGDKKLILELKGPRSPLSNV